MKLTKKIEDFTPPIVFSANSDADDNGAGSLLRSTFTAMTSGSLNRVYTPPSRITDADLDPMELLPTGAEIVRHSASSRVQWVLATVGKELVIFMSIGDSVSINVGARRMSLAKVTANQIMAKVPYHVIVDESVSISMWNLTNAGPSQRLKKINAPNWSEVNVNYPDRVSDVLGEMMVLNEPSTDGKIILWHGAPGTGKTSAIRTLMKEWKSWCSFHYIADPEKFFANPMYLMEVGSGGREAEWRLVIAEDSDEFLRATARKESGAALGRLLNFADGILGQGSNTIFLMTTNEPLDKLHPAIIRPGRCMAQVEFSEFTTEQAKAWLPEETELAPGPKTLAELIAIRDKTKVITTKSEERFGFKA